SVTTSSRVFSQQTGRWFTIKSQMNPEVQNLSTNFINTDHAFTEQMGIELIAGRRLRYEDHSFDGDLVDKILINETAVAHFKLGDARNAIGKKLEVSGKSWEIVGVIADFHQRSLHQPMEPMVLTPYLSTQNYLLIKTSLQPDDFLTSKITTAFKTFYPGNFVDYFYLDDYYNERYANDQTIGVIAQLFTVLAILIALLGLYGLVMITMNRRTKEIAVRKVLGASLGNILLLLGRDFVLLILIAAIIGLPISYFILDKWLENYAYSNGVEWWILTSTAIGLVVISMATVLVQTRKVANGNPADSLKYE
ncbi:MAG: FtsX-like permease family protein, partial [Cyclobacteriaceae bacterium]